MRKFLALVLALVMTMSLVTVSAGAATDFADDADITNEEAVEVLNAMGVLTGNNGKFNPNGKLTRGAGAKIIAYLMLGQTAADKLQATYTVFEDVTDGVGLAPYIEWAEARGIVGGYGNGKFGPYDTLTEYAFGKMLLAALGYDAAEQGYIGAGWQKNVYADALTAGIFEGTETYGACIRDTAARMALGALKANVVTYGTKQVATQSYWYNYLLNKGGFATVEGLVVTDLPLWSFYDGLKYVELAADTFGRPGHYWSYTTKTVDFAKFYMDAPIMEYTTEVSKCQLTVDCGIAKNSTSSAKVYAYDNGKLAGTDGDAVQGVESVAWTHANCGTAKVGGQGVLTQVFALANGEYVITEIDTYLAQVSTVVPTTHNVDGATHMTVYLNEGTIANNDKLTLDVVSDVNLGYARGTYLLVNLSAMAPTADTQVPEYLQTESLNAMGTAFVANAGDYKNVALDSYNFNKDSATHTDYIGTDVAYIGIVGEPAVIAGGEYKGAATDKSWGHVNGARILTNKNFEKTASTLKPLTAVAEYYDFFVDQYGNLIGDAVCSAPFTYAVIDALAWRQGTGLFTADYADVNLVDGATGVASLIEMYKYNHVGVKDAINAAGNDADSSVAQDKNQNTKYTTANSVLGVVKAYPLATGGYDLVPVADDNTGTNGTTDDKIMQVITNTTNTGVITKGNPNITGGVVAGASTQFVIKYMDAATGKPAYKAVTGISNVDSMAKANFVAVYEGDGVNDILSTAQAASFIYVDLTAGYFVDKTEIVFVAGLNESSTVIGDTYGYKVYANGVEKEILSTSATLFDTNGTGVYKVFYNGDNVVSDVALVKGLKANNGATYGWAETTTGAATWTYQTITNVADGLLYANNTYTLTDDTKVVVISITDDDYVFGNGATTTEAINGVAAGSFVNFAVTAKNDQVIICADADMVADYVFVLVQP